MKEIKNRYDIIVIGSGAGGGTAVEIFSRYVKKGLSVLLLENGPYWTRENFTQRELEMSKIYYNRGAIFTGDKTVSIAAANTVGGSTAVYTGVSFRPPSSVIQKWRVTFGLDFLTDSYVKKTLDDIEKKINVHTLSKKEENDNNRLFREGCEKLSIPLKKLSINTKGCQAQGFCNLGCTAGAKQGTLEVQIPQALSRGVEIVYNAYVEKIGPNNVHFSVRTAPASTKANIIREGNYSVSAEAIVVAAGSLNTPPLLLRSESALRLRNNNVGRYLTLHPAVNVNGIHREKIKNYRGFPKLWFVDEFSDSQGFFLETSFYYPGITAKNNPHFGLEHQTLMDDYSKMMSILVLVHDHEEKENRVRVDSTGAPVVEYRVSKESRASLIRAIRKSAEIFFAAGCVKVALPASKKNVLTVSDLPDIENLVQEKYLKMQKSPLSSAHPMGGARMGADRNTAVTQPDGSLYGCPTVWIADASLFPTSSHVNPYETVMLLASRVAENTLRSLGAAK